MYLILLSSSLNSIGHPDLRNSLKIGLGSLMDIYSPPPPRTSLCDCSVGWILHSLCSCISSSDWGLCCGCQYPKWQSLCWYPLKRIRAAVEGYSRTLCRCCHHQSCRPWWNVAEARAQMLLAPCCLNGPETVLLYWNLFPLSLRV